MIVYRLEHKELGLGPFRIHALDNVEEYFGESYDDFHTICKRLNNSMTVDHMVPSRKNLENRVCGCESIKDIMFWFSKYIDILEEYGFVINTYETHNYMEYSNQVLFNKEKAKFVGEFDRELAC